jgi:hypothetical protein
MTFHWEIYFAGPRSRWSQRIDQAEVIARGQAPWRWLARKAMLTAFKPLDPTLCGYALAQDGVCLEHYDPPLPEAAMPLPA